MRQKNNPNLERTIRISVYKDKQLYENIVQSCSQFLKLDSWNISKITKNYELKVLRAKPFNWRLYGG